MTDSETLVQRFIDQELSGEERLEFVTRVGRDEVLRQRTIALEQMLLEAGRLPRPVVPDEFVGQVMARVGTSRLLPQRWAGALRAPRVPRWNFAGAAAACALSLVIGGAVGGALSWQRRTEPRAPGSSTSTAVAPRSTVLVRLVVLQPDARTVQAAGDFNGWNPDRTPLEQVSNGAWMATIPLEPGRYEYMFVVDGERWIADPFAAEQNDDGFGSRNAVLDVRPLSEAPL